MSLDAFGVLNHVERLDTILKEKDTSSQALLKRARFGVHRGGVERLTEAGYADTRLVAVFEGPNCFSRNVFNGDR